MILKRILANDWTVMDPEIDFAAMFAKYDTLVMGRKTLERMVKAGQATVPGMKIVVFSRTPRSLQTNWRKPRSLFARRPARTSGCLMADRCSAVFWKKAWWVVSKWG
jgi:hypothetical protein